MKKYIAIFLTVVMVFVYLPYSSANTIINRDEEITNLIGDILEYNLSKVNNNTQTDYVDSYELQLEEELFDLGVEVMTTAEVAEVFNNANVIMPRVDVPSTSTNIRWYTYRSTSTVSGTTYEVQHITATARTTNTGLAFTRTGRILYNDKSYVLQTAQYFASIYIQKTIGTIPIVQWLPYEVFFSNPTYTSSASASYTGLTSASFSFVKVSGTSDSTQELALSSNYLQFDGDITATGVINEQPVTKTKSFTYDGGHNLYCNTSSAITAYRNNTHYMEHLDYVMMSFAYNSGSPAYTCSISVPTFNYMGQVY